MCVTVCVCVCEGVGVVRWVGGWEGVCVGWGGDVESAGLRCGVW